MRFRVIQDRIVGLLDGFGEQTCADRRIIQQSVVLDFGHALAKIRQDGVHRNLAGNLTGSMAAHAIAHHKNAQPLVESEVIFVRRTNSAHIAAASNL